MILLALNAPGFRFRGNDESEKAYVRFGRVKARRGLPLATVSL